jgi:uncharacterized protein YecE (DUF72 family)
MFRTLATTHYSSVKNLHWQVLCASFDMAKRGKIFIGTSGWHYKHWVGRFYPAGIKDSEQLAYYLQHFKTVELNNSFYRLPKPQVFANWRKLVPANFIFAVKGNRFITHNKKLNVERKNISIFFKSVSKLKEKTGPILFQLPPKWNVNVDRFAKFLKQLPKNYKYAFEFRNHTWYSEEIYLLLRKYNCAFCVYELEYHLSPREVTADFVYLRLHGPGGKYQGSYSKTRLKSWAEQCEEWRKNGKDVYVYFDNDQLGYAAFNAQTFQELLMIKSRKSKQTKKQLV